MIGALATFLALGSVGWWKQDLVQEQYHWRVAMGPRVLTAEQEMEKAAKPGSSIQECENGCPEMIVVPAGSFMMGSEQGESDEKPVHKVTFAKLFAVSKYEVAFAEWDVCAAAGACQPASDSLWGRDRRPVINVSWYQVQRYVEWLSRLTGKKYRLLTEAEWEYAARAGTTTKYFWGDDVGKGNANCDRCDSEWDNKQTAPVGSFKANPFGLHDLHGNVWEWTQDCLNKSYAGAPDDGTAWTTVCRKRSIKTHATLSSGRDQT